MSFQPVVRIGEREVGAGRPCYVIAEAGSNHDGKLEQALELIDVAAEARADAVKFQVFRAERLYPTSAGVSAYLGRPERIYDIIARLEMPYEWLPKLAERANASGLHFLASVFDDESADRVAPFVPAWKIASYELTLIPLIRRFAATGKPLILSTGAATLAETAETVAAVEAAGGRELVLLQCTASYPAPVDSLNLHAIATLREAFGCPTGLSDHSSHPTLAPVAAVALGAAVVEKHYTLSRDLDGPDHKYAIEPDELIALVRAVRDTQAALGTGEKAVQPAEQELRHFARRAVFALRDIARDEVLTSENVGALRTGVREAGLAPVALDELLGRRATRALPAETPLQPGDFA